MTVEDGSCTAGHGTRSTDGYEHGHVRGVQLPAIIATPSKVAFNWYGRSPSLQKRIASKPAPGEDLDVPTNRLDNRARATDLVVQRRAGQGRQVSHRDDRLLGPEELL